MKARQKAWKGNNMQTIKLGSAANVSLKVLGDAINVFSEKTGHNPIVYPDNSGGTCKLVTTDSRFADFFEDVMLAEQAV